MGRSFLGSAVESSVLPIRVVRLKRSSRSTKRPEKLCSVRKSSPAEEQYCLHSLEGEARRVPTPRGTMRRLSYKRWTLDSDPFSCEGEPLVNSSQPVICFMCAKERSSQCHLPSNSWLRLAAPFQS